MMIRLKPHDASVLARVAQYETLTPEQLRQMLDSAGPEAQSVGLVLLNLATPTSAEVAETANAIKTWVHNNRRYRQRPEAALSGPKVKAA